VKNVIYKIRNVVNNKFYVGSTTNSRRRFWEHRKALRDGNHSCIHLQRAWNKYGEDCFKFEVVESVEHRDKLFTAEQRWLDEHFGRSHCYNTAAYADAPMRNASPEMRAHLANKTREWLKDNPHPLKGTRLSEERRMQCVEAGQKVPKGEDSPLYGVPRSDEVKAKISAKCKGLPNKMKGKTLSEQGRANIAAAVKRGEESHFYGKRPTNADDLQKAVHAVLPDRTTQTYNSLTEMRDTLGLAIGTIIRACKSGNPIKFGPHAGWVLSYVDGEANEAPEIPEEFLSYPRTRQEAKATGAKFYFTGMPCDRGHISPRKTKGTCVACMKEDYKKDNDRRKQKTLDTP
jgi:group I intron endonuclease